jgi:hypothetical protein
MCILENFMEDELYYQQLKNEYEYRMWELFIQQEEEKEQGFLQQAPQYFKDLEQYETSMMEKEYREILEWDLINN